jgi:hypothetical protein
MNLSHEDIKFLLVDYRKGRLAEDVKPVIEAHLKGCEECREELSLINELSDMSIPDPGGLFWETLPRRVINVSKDKDRGVGLLHWLIRPVPALAGLVLIVLITAISIYFYTKTGDFYISEIGDPLSISLIEISDLREKDIINTLEYMIVEDPEIAYELTFNGNSIYMDIAYLTEAEMRSLENILKTEMKGG